MSQQTNAAAAPQSPPITAVKQEKVEGEVAANNTVCPGDNTVHPAANTACPAANTVCPATAPGEQSGVKQANSKKSMPVRQSRRIFDRSHRDGSFTMEAGH
ncbi:hypothetical protein PCANC_02620 [Puccinia coronata f. sp. avenae]|uniref:Uncharacterized protein n=1 Tax=Puccinia coronata f. sp. avenae TaxID=200324 RepID=A0A2N5W5N0_9BASI|nr:hypothetical protein PCANC_02620 [Puccinia coronata f. sp. avenae]